MEIGGKFRTDTAKGCQIRQVKAIRAVARLDLMFLLGVRCPNLFLGASLSKPATVWFFEVN